MLRLFILISLISVAFSFRVNKFRFNLKLQATSAEAIPAAKDDSGMNNKDGWQKDVDKILDIDTSCDERRDLALGLVGKATEILDDVDEAIRSGDIKKIAPPELGYGMAVEGLEAVQNQIVSDIIPDLLSKGLPSLFEAGPKIAEQLSKRANSEDMSTLVEDVVSFAQDPSLVQSTMNTLQSEVKNVFKSIPEGLESPDYTIISSTSEFEIRKYNGYSVCRTTSDDADNVDDVNMMDPMASGDNFNELASYIFGKNTGDDELAMTTPVMTQKNSMEFVLADGLTADTAPAPLSSKVSLADIPPQTLAVRTFKGLATDGEVRRQREALEDALLAEAIEFDNLSLKVAQYNPPYTLPWLRRNEVTLKVTIKEKMKAFDEGDAETIQEADVVAAIDPSIKAKTDSDSDEEDLEFEVAPEAGD